MQSLVPVPGGVTCSTLLPATAQAGPAMLIILFLAYPFFEQLFLSACLGVSLCLRLLCVLVLTPVLL